MTPGEYPEYSKELIIEFDELMGTASAQSNVQKVKELFDNFGKTMDYHTGIVAVTAFFLST